jgi:hypothetical protein
MATRKVGNQRDDKMAQHLGLFAPVSEQPDQEFHDHNKDTAAATVIQSWFR